jgi:plastocyanin
MMLTSSKTSLLVLVAAVSVISCKRESPAAAVPPAPPAKPTARTVTLSNGATARVIEMRVTEEGFVPNRIAMKVGETVQLEVQRVTDETCAKEILIADTTVNEPLPLNGIAKVTYTASKPGNVKFGCGMDMMVGGTIAAE